MASQTISGQRWADGTTVSVYPAAAWPDPTQAPSGTAVTTAVVAGGSAAFTGLAENVRYVAYAGGLGVRFVVPQIDPTDARSLRARLDELAGDTFPAVTDLAAGELVSPALSGGDDTAAVQGWLNDVAATGKVGITRPVSYSVTALTYPAVSNGLRLRGSGGRLSIFAQRSGTAAPILAPATVASQSRLVDIEGVGFDAFGNASNTGGVILAASEKCRFVNNRISSTNAFDLQVQGGQVLNGDSMFNIIERNLFENPASSTHYNVELLPGPNTGTSPLGSHPDAARIVFNHFQSASNTAGHVGVKITAPTTDSAGYLGAEACVVAFNTFQSVRRPVQMTSQRTTVMCNRAENTSGIMDVVVEAGTTNFPSLYNVFIANQWETQGVPANFTFTDNSATGTMRLFDYPKGSTESGVSNGAPDTLDMTLLRQSSAFGEFYLRGRLKAETWPRVQLGSDGSVWLGNGANDITLKGARLYTFDQGAGQMGFRMNAPLNVVGSAGGRVLTSLLGGESADRWQILGDGTFRISSSGAPGTYDVSWGRIGAGEIGAGTGRLVGADGIRTREVNSTGLTSAQIDALFTVSPGNGTVVSDPTNNVLLVRQGGTWRKTAALTNIP